MFDFAEIFRSVEQIWILWILSASACVAITWWGLANLSWRSLLNVHRDEQGSAYTLAYAGVIPVYAVLMCLVVETSLALVAKFGTLYAGYSAARTAVVWLPHSQQDETEAKVQEAAVQSFVPFSNGLEELSAVDQGASGANVDRYIAAYKEHVQDPKSIRYLRAKYLYAEKALTTSFERQPRANSQEAWEYDVVATVQYKYAFHIPIIGRFVGTSSPDGFFWGITSRVRLTGEAPQNPEQSLGIRYASP